MANADRVLKVCTRFDSDDQLQFARAFGDFNPMHLDSQFARRLAFGDVVVHGVHTLLRALDMACDLDLGFDLPVAIGEISVRFPSPVFLDTDVDMTASVESSNEQGGLSLELTAKTQNRLVMSANIRLQAGAADEVPHSTDWQRRDPVQHSEDALDQVEGQFDVTWNEPCVAQLFPRLQRSLQNSDIATLAALSRLVGMECPGLRSIFSGFKLAHRIDGDREGQLTYNVRRFDQRFSKLNVTVSSGSLVGEVQAFLRPEPHEQPSIETIAAEINGAEFVGHRVLVIGGSRGLGELAAKALAAGGADVAITFHRGKEDADRVQSNMSQHGYDVELLQFNVLDPKFSAGETFGGAAPTAVLYMATPAIFVGGRESSSPELRARFDQFYLSGLQSVIHHYTAAGTSQFLTPSSEAVTHQPAGMVEYAESKSAMEAWARDFAQSHNVVILCPRWPRMETDQTMTNMPVETASPVPVVLESLRALFGQRD